LDVKTPVFEGPLELLLALVEREEVDIFKVSLAKVTDAYLAEVAARSETADKIINGHPALLFSHGEFIPRALKRERITEGEVRAAIREKGITRVEDVDAVVLENDGSLSVSWESKRPGETSLVDARVPGGGRNKKRSKH